MENKIGKSELAKMYGVAHGFHNCGRAEDIVSEAVERALTTTAQYDPAKGTSYSTWLCCIVVNVARMHYRRGNFDPVKWDEDVDIRQDMAEPSEEEQSDTDRLFAKAKELIFADPGLIKLGLCQEFLDYYCFGKWEGTSSTFDMIAEDHGLKSNTVRTAFRRAIERLRRKMENHQKEIEK